MNPKVGFTNAHALMSPFNLMRQTYDCHMPHITYLRMRPNCSFSSSLHIFILLTLNLKKYELLKTIINRFNTIVINLPIFFFRFLYSKCIFYKKISWFYRIYINQILEFGFHIIFIIVFIVYKICFIEFKCGFRYNFTKYHQNILKWLENI